MTSTFTLYVTGVAYYMDSQNNRDDEERNPTIPIYPNVTKCIANIIGVLFTS